MPRIVGRATAKWLLLPRYFTGEPCIWEHIAERYTTSGVCTECVIASRVINRDKLRQQERDRYAANPEKSSVKCKAYYAANKEKVLKKTKAYKAANQETIKAYHKARYATKRKKK